MIVSADISVSLDTSPSTSKLAVQCNVSTRRHDAHVAEASSSASASSAVKRLLGFASNNPFNTALIRLPSSGQVVLRNCGIKKHFLRMSKNITPIAQESHLRQYVLKKRTHESPFHVSSSFQNSIKLRHCVNLSMPD